MSANPNSLRFRIFGPNSRACPNQDQAEDSQARPKSFTIATKFKATVTEEIPECASPKRCRSPSSSHVSRKRLNTGLEGHQLRRVQSQPQIQFAAAKLKDAYAEKCHDIHQDSNSRLDEVHQLLLSQLRTQSQYVKQKARKASAVERIRHLSKTKVRSTSPSNRYSKLLFGDLIENYRSELPEWQEDISRLQTELRSSKSQLRDAFEALFADDGGPGTALIAAIDGAKENIRSAQEECLVEMRKLRREAEDELREKERNFDTQIQEIQEFVARFLNDNEEELEEREIHSEDGQDDIDGMNEDD